MHFILSRYFAVLGICVFLPWVSSSVLDTAEPSKTIPPTEVLPNSTIHSTLASTTNNVTHTTVVPTTSNVTHTTVVPTTSNLTHTTVDPTTSNVTHTTVAPTSGPAPITNHSTVEPTGTTKHDATNVTGHETTSHMTTANGSVTTANGSVTTANGSVTTFAPTSVASTIMITTPTSGGKSSQFDPASFLGGIVLMLGLSVIAFVAYRCYRNRRSSTPPYRVVDE